MTNPFAAYGKEIAGGDSRLVGRALTVAQIFDRLVGGGNASLVGMPRVGKSSIANAVSERLRTECPQVAVVRMKLSVATSAGAFFSSLLSKLSEAPAAIASGVLSPMQVPMDAMSGYEIVEPYLRSVRAAGVVPIAVIDEFDTLGQLDHPMPFLRVVRELAASTAGLSVFIVSRREVAMLERGIGGSTFSGVLGGEVYLPPLRSEDIEEMSRGCQDQWELEAPDLQELWALSGGHPFIAEMVLCHSLAARSIASGTIAILPAILRYYEQLEQVLTSEGLDRPLVRSICGPQSADDFPGMTRLESMGIIYKQDEGPGWRCWSDHMTAYMERRARQGFTWDTWMDVEIALRNLIGTVMESARGPEWMVKIRSSNDKVDKLLTECERKRQEEYRKFGVDASTELLDYSYPFDLWAILSSEWQLFSPVFKRTTAHWAERFEFLSKIRTSISHNRRLSQESDIKAQDYCNDIRVAIHSYYQIRGRQVV